MFLDKFDSVHFVGVGGIGMSALANFCLVHGKKTSGSDLVENEQVAKLKQMGLQFFLGHKKDNISNQTLVVFTSAVKKENIELVESEIKKIPLMPREVFLSKIFNSFENSIAICGCHGKTTTTALVGHVLAECKKSPTLFVGGVVKSLDANFFCGESNICVAEACEYKKSFLALSPKINCFLNIDLDHVDVYKDLSEVCEVFYQFAENTKETNLVFGDDVSLAKMPKQTKTFGFGEQNDTIGANVVCRKGRFSCDVFENGKKCGKLQMAIFGQHNLVNGLATFCVARELGLSCDEILSAIATFEGVERRFSKVQCNACDVYTDYAHHPVEISTLLKTVRLMNYEKVFLLFQPHTFSRTKAFFKEFVESLALADCVFVFPTYFAREEFLTGFDGKDLFKQLKNDKVETYFVSNNEHMFDDLMQMVQKKDVILLVGAGDIVDLAKDFARF